MNNIKIKIPFFIFLALAVFFTDNTFAALVDDLYKELQILDKSVNVGRKSYTVTAENFYTIYVNNPSGGNADEALLGAARTYRRSYERFKAREDLDKSLRYYNLLQGAFASSAARDAYLETSDIYRTLRDPSSARFALTKLINKYPESAQAKSARSILNSLQKQPTTNGDAEIYAVKDNIIINQPPKGGGKVAVSKASAGGLVTVSGVRYFSDKDYTRVVIDISDTAQYKSFWLKADPGIRKPPRLTIDVDNSVTASDLSKQVNIKDGLLSSVRVGYDQKFKRTRIVLDSENIKDFSVFQMANPSRIVVDLFAMKRKADAPLQVVDNDIENFKPTPPPKGQGGKKEQNTTDMTINKALGLKIKTIVIDPGHGGKDPGAIYNNVKEKDIILDIAKELRDFLKKDPSLTIYMTRETDVFIPLEERTAIANKYKADIFISVHANAAKNTAAAGVETYVFNVTNDRAALEVAALENNATTKATSDLGDILKDILKYSKLEDSLLLAGAVQKNVVKTAGSKSKSLGVKQAPFYVLLGARMPSILIETGFISNREEAARLKNASYRKQVAKGIHEGMREYIEKYNN